jgi:hypothetical protein
MHIYSEPISYLEIQSINIAFFDIRPEIVLQLWAWSAEPTHFQNRLIQPPISLKHFENLRYSIYTLNIVPEIMALTTTKTVILDQPSHWEPWLFVVKTIANGGDT